MEQMTLIQAMTVMQKHVEADVKDEEVLNAWHIIRNQTTQMIGTMITLRQIFEADHTVEDVMTELGTHEKHDP